MSTPSDDDLAKIRQRVAARPLDLQCRFELGAALSSRQDYLAGIPELQKAMSRPPVRLPAMVLLAEAFDARGMNDTAAQMREWIARELGDGGDSGSAPVPAPTRPFTP